MDPKDPDAEVTYGIDWSSYLGERTLLTSDWIAEAGLVVEASSIGDGTRTSVKISGGVANQSYKLTNRITFSGENGAETDDRTLIIPVREL
jgi:hypothetical protein